MLRTARIVMVSLVCVLAFACSGKEDAKPEEAPQKTEPKAQVPAAGNPATQPVTGITTDPGAAEPAAPSGLVPDLQKLADKACACKDKACANGIQDEVAKLMAEAKQPPKEETQTIANTMQKLQACVAAAQQK